MNLALRTPDSSGSNYREISNARNRQGRGGGVK